MTSEFAIAVHAVVYLNHKATLIKSAELAKNICTNPARVRRVLSRLVQHELIEAHEGVDGGYRFCRDPRSVTLAAILEAVGEQAVPPLWRSGDAEEKCLVASGMANVMGDVIASLNAACDEKLSAITVSDLDFKIFGTVETNA